MQNRLDLHNALCKILGSNNVYFQPPEEQRLKYPCIVYHLDRINTNYADNIRYLFHELYTITYISDNPDLDEIHNKLMSMNMCTFIRSYTSKGHHHKRYEFYY